MGLFGKGFITRWKRHFQDSTEEKGIFPVLGTVSGKVLEAD